MPAFVLLTKLPPEAVRNPDEFRAAAHRVADEIRRLQGVRWLSSYSVLGPYDIVDVFEAPDVETATQVALTIRSLAGVTTETYAAVPWEGFLGIVGRVPPGQ
ncbi:MAG: GYD domain-containing protein [Armatimonadetes bacterium]|nr:GYD domain-containing protein [Armatimonadota bacterium]